MVEVIHWYLYIDNQPDAPGLEDWLGMTWAEYTACALEGRLPVT
jgi:hypothetical protein